VSDHTTNIFDTANRQIADFVNQRRNRRLRPGAGSRTSRTTSYTCKRRS